MEGDSMTQFESLKRCCHCGAVIQSDDPKKEGYLSLETLNEISDREVLLCDSCYQKQRYNRSPAPMKTSEGILTMLKDAKASDALIVQVIDLTSFECSFDQNAAEFAKNLKYIVIGNKKDLMPKNYSDEDLKEHICNVYGEYGIKLSKDDIFLTSLLFSNDVSDITKAIERKRNGHDVYILGNASSGKSLFFSAFLKNYKNRSNHPVGVSRYFGTDLDVLKIPLDSSSFIYDTPGNLLSNSFTRYKDDPSLMKYILTDKPYISKKISISLNRQREIFVQNRQKNPLSFRVFLPFLLPPLQGLGKKECFHPIKERFHEKFSRFCFCLGNHLDAWRIFPLALDKSLRKSHRNGLNRLKRHLMNKAHSYLRLYPCKQEHEAL